MDYYLKHKQKVAGVKAEEAAGNVADSMAVRLALMERVHAGEITLAEAQDELKKIQRKARASGKITRAQAYRRA